MAHPVQDTMRAAANPADSSSSSSGSGGAGFRAGESRAPGGDGIGSGVLRAPAAAFEAAMGSLRVELEPVTHAKTREVIGYAARACSREEGLTSEAPLVAAAQAFGQLAELRAAVRELAVQEMITLDREGVLFVDIDTSDLLGDTLFETGTALSSIATRVVLQIRGWNGATRIADLGMRASMLRYLGYSLAVADVDPGRACIEQIAQIAPDYVKLESNVVRGLDVSAPRRRVVKAFVAMCRAMDATPVASGVATAAERDALVDVGCSIVQGALVVKSVPSSMKFYALSA